MLFKEFRLLLVAAAVVLFSLPAAAETEIEADIEMVITATRIEQSLAELPVTVNVVKAEEIAASQSKNVGEALSLLPGVVVKAQGSWGALTSVRVRG
ncbi:MAG: TonB-dependent receptor plug domain-containing protein, partial [bacterium]|nr:TonB-dependent receptor plug domain-containing protein [bacterium]